MAECERCGAEYPVMDDSGICQDCAAELDTELEEIRP